MPSRKQLVGQLQSPGKPTENVTFISEERPVLTLSERAAGIEWADPRYEPGVGRRYATRAEWVSVITNLYVSTTGDDSNDGETSSSPFATVQKAYDTISMYGPILPGRWVINLAAGTYTENITVDSLTRSDFPIDLEGPTAGHPNVPTAVIAASDTADTILSFSEGRNWFRIEDVRFTGATTEKAISVSACRLSLTNVHIDACLNGVLYQHSAQLGVTGGIFTGRGSGVSGGKGTHGLYASTHAIQTASAATGLQVSDYETGLFIAEGTQGHLDFTQVDTCAVGLFFSRGAGACNTKSVAIDDCAVGLKASDTGWFNNNIIFGATTANTVNVQTLGGSPEFDFRCSDNSSHTSRLQETLGTVTHTGTVSQTTLWTTVAIRDWMISEGGYTAKLILACQPTLTTSTCSIEIAVGGDEVATVVIPSGSGNTLIEANINFFSDTVQRCMLTATIDAANPVIDYDTGAISFKGTAANIKVNATLGNAGDTFVIRFGEYWTTLGG